jgi:hypothetical protein
MWEQYKRTFLSTQIFILALTAILFFKLGHNVIMTTTFLAMMELGGLVGAAWATRLKRILRSR